MDDAELVDRLRAGDEAAFVTLVNRYHTHLLRVAMAFVPSRAVAEEVVQETWLGVVKGIHRFEGRASLKTWLFRIVANRARTAGGRERRQLPREPGQEAAVPAGRFTRRGHWADPPARWADQVEDRVAAGQAVERLKQSMAELPDAQRRVVLLRDVEGLSSDEVCAMLGISDANQRVLLHRGRARLRATLERDMVEG